MKSLSYPFVIPAEAGIHRYLNVISYVSVFTGFPPAREQAWIPASAGMTERIGSLHVPTRAQVYTCEASARAAG